MEKLHLLPTKMFFFCVFYKGFQKRRNTNKTQYQAANLQFMKAYFVNTGSSDKYEMSRRNVAIISLQSPTFKFLFFSRWKVLELKFQLFYVENSFEKYILLLSLVIEVSISVTFFTTPELYQCRKIS